MKVLQVFTGCFSAVLFSYYFNSLILYVAIVLAFIYLGLLVDSINLTLAKENDKIKS